MSKTRTITATYDGVTFKRKTHRNYSHVIIGRLDVEKLVRCEREFAEKNLRSNWGFYTEVANGTHRNIETMSQAQLDEANHVASLGIDGAAKYRGDQAETRARNRAAKGWEPLAWAGRPDLAAKQVDEWKKSIHCFGQVLAIHVDA